MRNKFIDKILPAAPTAPSAFCTKNNFCIFLKLESMNISNLPNYARDHVGRKSHNDALQTTKSQIDDCLY